MPLLPTEPSPEEVPSLTGSSQTAQALCWDLSSLFGREGPASGGLWSLHPLNSIRFSHSLPSCLDSPPLLPCLASLYLTLSSQSRALSSSKASLALKPRQLPAFCNSLSLGATSHITPSTAIAFLFVCEHPEGRGLCHTVCPIFSLQQHASCKVGILQWFAR